MFEQAIKTQYRLLFFLLCIAAFQCVFFYPRLPDLVASHFNFSGYSDGWSSKNTLFTVYVVTVFILSVIFIAVPASINSIPTSLINLPNRNYWLAPFRRQETIEFIKTQFLWYGVITLSFMVYTFQLVFEANLQQEPRLSQNFIWTLTVFLVYSVFWTFRFIHKFYDTT